jgi:hypothetical protein
LYNVDLTALNTLLITTKEADVLTRSAKVPRSVEPLLDLVILLHLFKGHVRLHTQIVSVFRSDETLLLTVSDELSCSLTCFDLPRKVEILLMISRLSEARSVEHLALAHCIVRESVLLVLLGVSELVSDGLHDSFDRVPRIDLDHVLVIERTAMSSTADRANVNSNVSSVVKRRVELLPERAERCNDLIGCSLILLVVAVLDRGRNGRLHRRHYIGVPVRKSSVPTLIPR